MGFREKFLGFGFLVDRTAPLHNNAPLLVMRPKAKALAHGGKRWTATDGAAPKPPLLDIRPKPVSEDGSDRW